MRDTSIIRSIYGTDDIPPNAWFSYAQALVIVSAADGKLTDQEIAWLLYDFGDTIQASEEFRQHLRSFDPNSESLERVLERVAKNFSINYLRALIYDSLKMAQADNNLHDLERGKARELAKRLQVPVYIARTIEGLVNTEKSVSDIRRSIFEVETDETEEGAALSANNWAFKSIFGMSQMPKDLHRYYGYALMAIAGADGVVSQDEEDWYLKEFVPAMLTPPEIVEEVLAYDFKKANLKDIVDHIQADMTGNFAKMLLYHAIQMARADGDYAEEEQQQVERIAQELGVPADIAQTIQYLVDTEERIAKMRKTLFKAEE